MEGQGHGQTPVNGTPSSAAQLLPYGAALHQFSQVIGANPPASSGQPTGFTTSQAQLAYQHIHLHQQLHEFWTNQYHEVSQTVDFKNQSLPLVRIKKIMKADEDVRMISAEAPVVFARACEMFILELTLRSWSHTEENKRRTLQKNDIAAAITRTNIFDFLVDIVPREDLKDEVLGSIPRGTDPPLPYYYLPPQHPPQVGSPGGMMMGKPVGDQAVYGQPGRAFMPPQMWPQLQQQQPPDDS